MSSKARKLRRANMSEGERKQRAFIRFLNGNGMHAIAAEEKMDLMTKWTIKDLLKQEAKGREKE